MDVSVSNLPDTQNGEEIVYSQQADVEIAWGWLYAVRKNFKSLELLKDEYFIGRLPSCDFVLSLNEVSEKVLMTFSKLHCKITKEIIEDTNVVYLEDLSFNGTHVNGEKVGKGNKIILQNNDVISLSSPLFKVFVFIDSSCDASNHSEEVKRRYVISRSLGVGAFGEVLLVFERKTSERFAMKVVPKKVFGSELKNTSYDPEKIMNEVNILKALRHPCIISVYDIFDAADKVYIILELMEGGELFDRIFAKRQLSEKEAKWIFYQLIIAVQYLHAQGITHRDLKPENVLLASEDTETIVKVSDFGLSKFMDSQVMMTTFCGTPLYVAPEVLETRGRGCYTNQIDVWSLGVILYVCLSGHVPFSDEHKTLSLQEQICSGTYTFSDKLWKGVSENAIDLIKKMMTVNPKKRITIDKITTHPWLKDEAMIKRIEQMLKGRVPDENEPPLKRLRLDGRTPQ